MAPAGQRCQQAGAAQAVGVYGSPAESDNRIGGKSATLRPANDREYGRGRRISAAP